MQDKPMAACPDWALIKNKYLAGAGLRSLARKAGIPEGTILSRAKREGWKAAKRWRLCPWCGCKFKECDPSCGYRSTWMTRIREVIRRRSRLAKKRQIAKQKQNKAQNREQPSPRTCHCGNLLPKWRRYCTPKCRPKTTRKRKERKCGHCDNPITHSTRMPFCSHSCRKMHHGNKPRQVSCRECGSDFTTARKSQVFCSKACYRRCGAKRDRGRRHRKNKPVERHPFRCFICNKETIHPRRRFCSDKCSRVQERKNEAAKKVLNKKPLKSFAEKQCAVCHASFKPKSDNHLHCSHKCSLKSSRRRRRIKERGVKKPVHVRIKQNLSGRLRELLRRKGEQKKNVIISYMGCTPKEMVSHIEKQFSKGMTWENYGVFGWHLDHIIPCERFDLTNEDHCRVCFNWRNIRPLWGEDNCNRQEMLTLDEALQLDPALLEMTSNVGVKLW